MNHTDIRQAMSRYKFYHVIPLTDDIATPGNPAYVPAQNLCMKHLRSLDLRGKRVLDIGCRDGLFSFAAESMGAKEVIGIDNDLSTPATEFLIPFLNSKIKLVQMNLYDLKPDTFGFFDVVVFPGVLYHLRYPFEGLRVIRDVLKVGGRLLIETPIWKGENNNAMLFCPTGAESPYEPTSCTFFNQKGLTDTLTSMGLETIAIEYLRRTGARRLVDFARQLSARIEVSLRVCLSGNAPPIKRVTRSVFHSVFHGSDNDSFTTQYWEATHHFHTENGG
jgi:2-polyprenyl-3-methyl-5-hydroxy-6-metoxy-1,4-benzoquinol methylase